MKTGSKILCVDGSGCKHKVRAGKIYTVALYRTAAEAMGMSTDAQVWIDGVGMWLDASRFKDMP